MYRMLILPVMLVTTSAFAAEPIVSTAVIDAPRSAVWKAWTTSAGAVPWMVAQAEIDLKLGGILRTHYDANAKLGDPGTIENTILSYDPEKMLSIKNTKHPMKFPFPNAIKSMWTVIYLEDAGPGKTKVTVIGHGFGDDEESQKMRAFFQRGNDITVERLQKHFANKK
jgi:uncharacterized protein YndB with AHSA1/START domain